MKSMPKMSNDLPVTVTINSNSFDFEKAAAEAVRHLRFLEKTGATRSPMIVPAYPAPPGNIDDAPLLKINPALRWGVVYAKR